MRRVVFLIAVLGLLLGSPGVAVAAYSETNGITFIGPFHSDNAHPSGSPDCIWNAVRISSDMGQPWLSSTVSIERTIPTAGGIHECGDPYYTAERNQLAVRQDLMYHNKNTNKWTLCNPGPWVQNTNGPMQDLTTTFAWASRPCFWGTVYYGASQGASFWNHWHYGILLQTNAVVLR
jgi:hypothetical protein